MGTSYPPQTPLMGLVVIVLEEEEVLHSSLSDAHQQKYFHILPPPKKRIRLLARGNAMILEINMSKLYNLSFRMWWSNNLRVIFA